MRHATQSGLRRHSPFLVGSRRVFVHAARPETGRARPNRDFNKTSRYGPQRTSRGNFRRENDMSSSSRPNPIDQPGLSESNQPQAPSPNYTHTFYATCHPGLEQVVVEELKALGVPDVEAGRAGVVFRSNHVADGYRANIWLRSAIRVLQLLSHGPLDQDKDGYQALYGMIRGCGVRWADIIPNGATFTVEPRLWSCTNIISTRLVWQTVKDAVSDAIFDARAQRPRPPTGPIADVPLYVTAYRDHINVYRDMSGTSLHRRGYRENMHKSPLNEAAAAGVLMLGGWHKQCAQGSPAVLADPMCGSGTLLIEAAMIAHNIAPGLGRAVRQLEAKDRTPASTVFPCVAWPDADLKMWHQVVEEAQRARRRQWEGRIYGNDIHEGALHLSITDIQTTGFTHCVKLHRGDAATWQLPEVPGLVATNPPWGLRLMSERVTNVRDNDYDDEDGKEQLVLGRRPRPKPDTAVSMGDEPQAQDELETCWRSLSDFLRSQCPDTDALVVSGNKDNFNYLRMKPSAKHKLTVAGLDVAAHLYHVLPPKPK